jgi:hypothetical protein
VCLLLFSGFQGGKRERASMTNTAQDKAEAIKREAQQLSKDIQALKEEATKLLTQLAQLKR